MIMSSPCPKFSSHSDLVIWQVLPNVMNHRTAHSTQILRFLNDLGVETFSQDNKFYLSENL